MRGRRAQRRAAAAAASAGHQCPSCWNVYDGAAAYAVHFESGPGSRCLPGDARGQLVQLPGGRWAMAWRHPAARRI